MKPEIRKQSAEAEVRSSVMKRLFQRLSWSGALEIAEFDSEGKLRAGKIRKPTSYGNDGEWIHCDGVLMPRDGNPAELGILFVGNAHHILSERFLVTLAYNEEGMISVQGGDNQTTFSGQLYKDHKLNPDVKSAIDAAFKRPIHSRKYPHAGEEFINKYLGVTQVSTAA